MDYIWTPWRYAYLSSAGKSPGCLFCDAIRREDRDANIVFRGTTCFVVLNAFPYTSGHVMVVPYDHVDRLDKLPSAAATEMMSLVQRVETAFREVYHPDGINVGMNIGAAAGAGVAGHIHMHALPRWIADANFMTTIGETRVIPEDLATTWERMRSALR